MANAPAPSKRTRGALHPAIRVALYLPALAVGSTLLVLVTSLLLGLLAIPLALPAGLAPGADGLSEAEVLLQGASMVAFVLVTYLFRRLLDRRGFRSLGLQTTPGWIEEGLIGFGLGALLMGLILLVELLSGAYRLRGFGWQELPAEGLALGLLGMFLVFVLVSFNEELVSRGYLLQNLMAAWGVPVAVALSSALFSVAHLGNPGAGLVSTLGIFVAGLHFAVGYLLTGRLWLPMGLHLSWNYFQGPVFGFPVSGLDTPSMLLLEPVGPTYLTGGGFGPEASILGFAADLLGIALIYAWARSRRPNRVGALSR